MFHSVEIAGMVCPNNVFLAPLAGYTNYPVRSVLTRLGAGLTFTEMVSCKGLHYQNEETKKLLYCGSEAPKAAQIFGSDPAVMREACESELLAPYDLIDINMGCPMRKIITNGEGSALMENMPLAQKVISECVKSGKRISVKFRTGIKKGDKLAAEFAKRAEGAGACMVTVHGRVRDAIYAGEVDFEEIARVKSAVKIPVIANGGIFSKADAVKILNETGADGVMIARAALSDWNIFKEILGEERKSVLPHFLRLVDEEEALYGKQFALVFTRKMAAFMLKGIAGAAEKRKRFFECKSTEEVKELAQRYFQ